jgi:hypothetical protein
LAVRRGAAGTVNAELSQLSPFWLAIVNSQNLFNSLSQVMTPLVQLLDLRGAKPACADQPAKLPNGDTVKVQNISAPDLLWLCLQVLADGQIQVTVHSGSATPWRVRTTGGQYNGPAEVDPKNVLVQGLYESIQQDRAHNDGLVLPQSAGVWQMSASSLPVNMGAVISPGAWWGQFAIFVPTFLLDIAAKSVKAAAHLPEFAKHFSAVMGKGGCAAKILEAVPDGEVLTFDGFVKITQAELACADTIAELLGGALSPLQAIIVIIFTDAVPLLWGAVEGVLRGLLTPVRNMSSLTWSVVRQSSTPTVDPVLQPFVGRYGNAQVTNDYRMTWGDCGSSDGCMRAHLVAENGKAVAVIDAVNRLSADLYSVGDHVPLSKVDKPMYAAAGGPCLHMIPPKTQSGDPDEMCVP